MNGAVVADPYFYIVFYFTDKLHAHNPYALTPCQWVTAFSSGFLQLPEELIINKSTGN
jgi:hypothetical protein